ncbi:hypothetical protein [Wolbachia endosymbiont (group A) of Chalcis sispes]|uniref:hypothetical protein n=1 Tax=Wolbachia endosymbiont (group A) of Chalcis sispes TaxID=3066197 RepID=UPI0031334D98
MDLGVGNDVDHSVKSFKNMIIRSTYSVTKVMIDGFILAPPLGRKDASVLVPVILDDKGARLLTHEEALKLNYTFNNVVLGDLNSKTQAKLSVNGSSEVYGIDFSNPYISHCVITKIIKNSVINKDHELSIDPELRFRALSRSPSTELLDMKLESPTCSQGVASKDSPRQWSGTETEKEELLYNPVNSVRTSDRPLTDLSYATTSCGVPGISRDLSAGEGTLTEANIPDQKRSSSIPSFRAWDSSTFLNSEDSLKDTENICNEEPEKQQVTDESDRKSSDEGSKAKPQKNESSKKHGGGLQSKIKSFFSLSPQPKQHNASFKRHDEGRDTKRSTPETPVTEKPPVSTRSPSLPIEIVKSRSLKVTPVTEVHTENKPTELNDSITELPSQGTVGKLNMPGDRSSKISVDSGLGSLERSQSLPLTEKSSGSSQRKQNILKQFFSAFLSDKGKTTKDILFDEETFSRFSSGMQKVLSLSLSCDMVSNLCRFFPINEHEELIVLARSGKVKKSRSPEEIEQLFSSFSREEKEICSLLFFPEKQNEMCENLSPTAKEQVDLFWTILDERGISGNASTSSKDSGVSLGSSSQKSTSDTGSDEDGLEASGGSSVSSNSSTSTVRTKMDATKIEQYLQEGKEVFV